jgi:hypothetical protein
MVWCLAKHRDNFIIIIIVVVAIIIIIIIIIIIGTVAILSVLVIHILDALKRSPKMVPASACVTFAPSQVPFTVTQHIYLSELRLNNHCLTRLCFYVNQIACRLSW